MSSFLEGRGVGNLSQICKQRGVGGVGNFYEKFAPTPPGTRTPMTPPIHRPATDLQGSDIMGRGVGIFDKIPVQKGVGGYGILGYS